MYFVRITDRYLRKKIVIMTQRMECKNNVRRYNIFVNFIRLQKMGFDFFFS